MTKKKILEKAKKEGLKIHHGNPKKVASLDKIGTSLKLKHPIKFRTRDLLNCF